MQTIIDLPEPQLEALNALAEARDQTPSQFLAEVLSGVLAPENLNEDKPGPLIDGYHLWGEHVTATASNMNAASPPSGPTAMLLFDTNIVIDLSTAFPRPSHSLHRQPAGPSASCPGLRSWRAQCP